jgi:hypothetical protein
MFSEMSRRNAALSAAAWRGSSGGHNRVFALPARGAFAMTPIAHMPRRSMRYMPLNQL